MTHVTENHLEAGMERIAAAIDINGQRITGALIDETGALDALYSAPTPINDGQTAILDTIKIVCQRVLESTDEPVSGIGISTIGLVHHLNGRILYAKDELQILQDVPLAQILQDELGLITRVENNVNAMALAEAHLGAGQDVESFFYIYADTDLNGAIVRDGQLLHGTHFSAGQIGELVAGWMSQKPILLSQKASGEGIVAEYSMRSRKFRVPVVRDILQFAHHGDQLAIRVVRDGAILLGLVLSPVISLLDPERVIVGGGLLQGGSSLWWDSFLNTLRESPLPALQEVDIMKAKMTDYPQLVGAALLVLNDDDHPSALGDQA